MILTGAFAAAVGSEVGGPLVGIVYGCLAGVGVAAVQANLSHRLAANQFVVGLTLNVLAVGLTAFLNAEMRPTVTKAEPLAIPLLSKIPLIGGALFDQTWLLYLLYPLI